MAISLNAASSINTLANRLGAAAAVVPPPPPVPAAAPPAPPPAPTQTLTAPAAAAINPVVARPPILHPPILQPPIFIPPGILQLPPQNKTATQLANGAIAQLNGVAVASITQGLNAVKSKSLDGAGLIPYLERKVRIGEVLNTLAKDWTAATRTDFADAFSMDANNLNNDVVDSIVSIAILNDKDLDGEILAENTPQTTPADLTDNRRIVWQSAPPGTVLNPPYVILVAVEYQDVATAEDTLHAITNQLAATASGFRLPKTVIQKGVN